MIKLQLGHIELFVADTQISKDFYISVLGFDFVTEQADGQFVWLKSGGIELLLRAKNGGQDRVEGYSKSAVGLVLYTDDLAACQADLVARGLVFRGNDGSPNCPTFCDPDGHWWQLVNPEY